MFTSHNDIDRPTTQTDRKRKYDTILAPVGPFFLSIQRPASVPLEMASFE